MLKVKVRMDVLPRAWFRQCSFTVLKTSGTAACMRRWAGIPGLFFAIFLQGLAGPAIGAEVEEPAARNAAEAWLELVDEDKFSEAWKETASFFREKMKEKTFVADLERERAYLGPFKSRKLVDVQELVDPPKAPPGRYVVLLYKTAFGKPVSLGERVSMLATGEDTWSVAGYHLVR